MLCFDLWSDDAALRPEWDEIISRLQRLNPEEFRMPKSSRNLQETLKRSINDGDTVEEVNETKNKDDNEADHRQMIEFV